MSRMLEDLWWLLIPIGFCMLVGLITESDKGLGVSIGFWIGIALDIIIVLLGPAILCMGRWLSGGALAIDLEDAIIIGLSAVSGAILVAAGVYAITKIE